MNKNCTNCGVEMVRPKRWGVKLWSETLCCSHHCGLTVRYKKQREEFFKQKKECKQCKKMFSPSGWAIKQSTFDRKAFCSKDCKYKFISESKKPKIMFKECIVCGNLFTRTLQQCWSEFLRIKTCGKTCQYQLAASKRMGKNNPSWKGGITSLGRKIRKTYLYRMWKESIWKRDNKLCQVCFTPKDLVHVHHIKGFSRILVENNITSVEEAMYCKELWDIKNGRVVCYDCHEKEHKDSPIILGLLRQSKKYCSKNVVDRLKV